MKGEIIQLDGGFGIEFCFKCKHYEFKVDLEKRKINNICHILKGLPDPHNEKVWDFEKRVCKYYEPREK